MYGGRHYTTTSEPNCIDRYDISSRIYRLGCNALSREGLCGPHIPLPGGSWDILRQKSSESSRGRISDKRNRIFHISRFFSCDRTLLLFLTLLSIAPFRSTRSIFGNFRKQQRIDDVITRSDKPFFRRRVTR